VAFLVGMRPAQSGTSGFALEDIHAPKNAHERAGGASELEFQLRWKG
jgi:hypothetical protein